MNQKETFNMKISFPVRYKSTVSFLFGGEPNLRNLYLYRFPLAFVFLTISMGSPLFAFQPGKWSHTDDLILGTAISKPRELHVLDINNKIIQKAVFEYGPNGRLESEKYYDAGGIYSGYTKYLYDSKNKIVSETLFDSKNTRLNKTEYRYKGEWLYAIDFSDNSNKIVMTQRYRHDGAKLIGGEEISGDSSDRFTFTYKGSKIISVQVLGPDKSSLSEVTYKYSPKEKILERIRKQGNQKSICKYEYSGDTLLSFVYFNQSDDKWTFDKKLVLVY
jgi:hypothetical protein